jgi:hypothetical protein
MMLQTFRGRPLDEARKAAQAAFGPDTVILTTPKVVVEALNPEGMALATTGAILDDLRPLGAAELRSAS